MKLHKQFIKLRKKLGLSQEEVAKKCKMSCSSIKYFESGKKKRVTLGFLISLASSLDHSIKISFSKDPIFAETERIEKKGW